MTKKIHSSDHYKNQQRKHTMPPKRVTTKKAVRQSKVGEPAIDRIPENSLKRLAKKAVTLRGEAAQQVSTDAVAAIRAELKNILDVIVKTAVVLRDANKLTTLYDTDVIAALTLHGIQYGNGFGKNGISELSSYKPKKAKEIQKDGKTVVPTLQRNTKIRHLQMNRDALIINPSSIGRLIREITLNHTNSINITPKALVALHIFSEARLLEVIQGAIYIMSMSEMVTLSGKHVEASIHMKPLKSVNAAVVRSVNIKGYLLNMLKIQHPDLSLNSDTKIQLNSISDIILSRILTALTAVYNNTKRVTVGLNDIVSAVSLIVDGNLECTMAIGMFTAVDKWEKSQSRGSQEKPLTAASRANITLPPSRFKYVVKNQKAPKKNQKAPGTTKWSRRAGPTANVALAAALDALISELLSIAGDVTIEEKAKRVTTAHIRKAINGDEGFSALLKGVIIGTDSRRSEEVANYLQPKKSK